MAAPSLEAHSAALQAAYVNGSLNENEYIAACRWRDDGVGVMSAERRSGKRRPSGQKPVIDIMRASAADRFKRSRKKLRQIGVDEPTEALVFREQQEFEPEDWARIKDGMAVLVIQYGLANDATKNYYRACG